jgi:hypothetical protein
MIYMVLVLPDPRPVPKYGSGSVLKWFRIQLFLRVLVGFESIYLYNKIISRYKFSKKSNFDRVVIGKKEYLFLNRSILGIT